MPCRLDSAPSPLARRLAVAAVSLLAATGAEAACGDFGDPNHVENCDLASTDVSVYFVAQGSCVHNASVGASSGPGSLLCDAASDGFGGFRFVVNQCVTPPASSTAYGVAVSARFNSGTTAATCTVQTAQTSALDCSGLGPDVVSGSFSPGVGLAFTRSPKATHTTGVTVNAAWIQVTCSIGSPGGADFTVFLDDFFLGTGDVPLFSDDSGLGTTSRWSATAGGI